MPEVTGLDGFEVYLGRAGGRDVTTAATYVVDGEVGIFNVATRPSTAAAVTAPQSQTAQYVKGSRPEPTSPTFESSAIGESVYRRLGFREVVTYVLLTRPAEVSPTS